MIDMKSSRIIVHTPLPVSLLQSQFQDVNVASDCRKIQTSSRTTSRNMRSASCRQERLCSSALRRLQVKIESENQQMREIIQPLIDTENTLMKELQSFLELQDVTELRRKELLHKSWTEKVWFPLQRKVEQHVSSCGASEAERRRSSFRNYLQHCSTKGFVFLETYDVKEYDPFPHSTAKPNYFKLRTAALKDPFHRRLPETLQEETTSGAGCEHSRRREDDESVTSPIDEVNQESEGSTDEDEAEHRIRSRFKETRLIRTDFSQLQTSRCCCCSSRCC